MPEAAHTAPSPGYPPPPGERQRLNFNKLRRIKGSDRRLLSHGAISHPTALGATALPGANCRDPRLTRWDYRAYRATVLPSDPAGHTGRRWTSVPRRAKSARSGAPRQNRPAVVIGFHHAAFADIPCLRIARMHPQRLASLNFRRPADAAVVVLTVQAGARLAGEQMKRPARASCRCRAASCSSHHGWRGIHDSQTRRRWPKRVQSCRRVEADSAADRRENRRKICGRSGALYSSTPCCQKSSNEGSAIPSSCARGLDSS